MEKAFELMYQRLSSLLVENLDLKRGYLLLEAGCGNGQLTIPLAQKLNGIKDDMRMVALDSDSGPYKESLGILKRKLRELKLQRCVKVACDDVRIMKSVENESVDVIVSNELLCDLDREGLKKAMQQFYRVLKPNGQMAHGELSPVPENYAQALLIEADMNSQETAQPRPPWFSPYSDEVASVMHQTGFTDIRSVYFETKIRMNYSMAVSKLREWSVLPTFIQKHSVEIQKHGLEFPMEHVIFCKK
jgi:ubiquinone/menaquinone biosynthesis C-methylase UbiE